MKKQGGCQQVIDLHQGNDTFLRSIRKDVAGMNECFLITQTVLVPKPVNISFFASRWF
jgi:hypothetical protein